MAKPAVTVNLIIWADFVVNSFSMGGQGLVGKEGNIVMTFN